MGGDTTRGPLDICITVFGEVPAGQALLRSGARAGDDIWVSGTLGDARLALEAFRGTLSLPPDVFDAARAAHGAAARRAWRSGLALRGIASAAIDLSDGLLGDLGHVLRQSGVGATVDTRRSRAACSPPRAAAWRWTRERIVECVLAGGDDYELAFTAPAGAARGRAGRRGAAGTPVTRIGGIEAQPGLRVVDAPGPRRWRSRFAGFDHFGSCSDPHACALLRAALLLLAPARRRTAAAFAAP